MANALIMVLPSGANLFDNTDFETNINGAVASGTVPPTLTQDTAHVLSGTKSLKSVYAGGNVLSTITFQKVAGTKFPVTTGLTYRAVIPTYLEATVPIIDPVNGRHFTIYFDWFDSGGGGLSTTGLDARGFPAAWNILTAAATAPASAAFLLIRIQLNGEITNTAYNAWMDLVWVGVDGGQPQLLQSPAPAPANRFRNWTPDVTRVGEHEVILGTGLTSEFLYRRDYIAKFDVPYLPASTLAVAFAVIEALLQGATITVVTGDLNSATYTCVLAPGTVPKLALTDTALFEYTLSLVLKNVADAPLTVSY